MREGDLSMSVANDSRQLSLTDSFNQLTVREQNVVRNSWAACFSDEIFSNIDASHVEILYSDRGSRPSTPVNVIVKALVIREMLQLSDYKMVNTLSRFRIRCTKYLKEAGNDLRLPTGRLNRRAMELTGRARRMEALMISANINQAFEPHGAHIQMRCKDASTQAKERRGITDELKNYLNRDYGNQIFHYLNGDERKDTGRGAKSPRQSEFVNRGAHALETVSGRTNGRSRGWLQATSAHERRRRDAFQYSPEPCGSGSDIPPRSG